MNAPLTAVSLFAGAGGGTRGLLSAGLDVRAAVDHDATALQSLRESVPVRPVVHNLRDVDPSVLPENARSPTVVSGGPPCQGFSYGGHCNADDERNSLVWRFVEWVGELRPRVAIMENVPGMQGTDPLLLDQLCGDGREPARQETLFGETAHERDGTPGFASVGYRARWRILSADDYRAPQSRRRVFVLAVRDDVATPEPWFPEPTTPQDSRTAVEAIHDLTSTHAAADGGRPRVTNHTPQNHRDDVREQFAEWEPGKTAGRNSESRLAADEPSRTITAGNATPPVHYADDLPTGHRRLTVRECARLQTFPDDHLFVGGMEKQYQQVANAIPPVLMEHLGRHVRRHLGGGSA